MLQDVMRVWLALLQISQHDFTMLWDLSPRSKSAGGYGPPPSKSVGGFGPPSADLDPPTKLSENIILNVLVKMDDTLRSSAY